MTACLRARAVARAAPMPESTTLALANDACAPSAQGFIEGLEAGVGIPREGVNAARTLHRAGRRDGRIDRPEGAALFRGDRQEDGGRLHPHLHGKGPAGDVVRALRRAVGRRAQVGPLLRFEKFFHQGREGLIHQDHPGVRICGAVGREGCGALIDLDAVDQQLVDQHRGGVGVALCRGMT